MPKSRRDKIVNLTKVTKKGRDQKAKLVENIREACDQFDNIFVFETENMRNTSLKELRVQWIDSRFFLGKNKVMCTALGLTAESEQKPELHKLTRYVKGNCGLLFTNRDKAETIKFFKKYSAPHFARSGFKATASFHLKAGPLEDMPFSMELQLRKLGLPVELKDGVVVLLSDTQVCNKGDILTPEQAKILELFEQLQAVFRFKMICVHEEDKFELLVSEEDMEE